LETSVLESGSLHLGTLEVCPLETRCTEVGSLKLAIVQLCPPEVCPGKVDSLQLLAEASSGHFKVAKIGTGEVSL